MIQTTPVHVVEGHDETASGLSSACPPGILIHWNTIHVPLVDSVLVLYRSYPGDPGLQDYLKAAIQDGILPVSTFVSTLLQAARSPELHIPATLDTLCRIALDFHYSSGQPPLGSVVPASASVTVILGTIQDALALLRTAHSLPISHFHQFITSASELVILLLTCVPDISQVPTTQAMLHFSDANELLLTYSLAPDVRQVLDTFVMSLTLLIGDDAKATREAQMMHTIQLTLGKGDILGPSSDTDTITLGLLLNYMVRIFTCLFLLLRFSLLPVVYLPLLLPLFQIAFADAVFWLVTERLPTGRMNMEQVMTSMRWRSLSRASAGHPGRQPSVTRSCYYPHLHV